VEQVSCRLCALSTLLALFSHQACAPDLCPIRCRGSLWNSIILFSLKKAAVAILLVSLCSRLPVASVLRLNCFDPSSAVIGAAR
jgi:hypothetical protein